MQLLVHITSHEDSVNPIMKKLMEVGIHGASVLDCEGMLQAINRNSVDAPSIFGGLRQFVNPDRQQNKMIIILCKDEEVEKAKQMIHDVSGDLKLPNTGVMFTLPVSSWEGMSK